MSNDLDRILPSKDSQEETIEIFFNDPANTSLISTAITKYLSNLPPDESSVEEIQNFLNRPATIFLLTKVPILSLNRLNLNMVPDELNRLENLIILNLSNNPDLNDIPDLHFKNLITLTFQNNLPTEVLSLNHLPMLRTLDLHAHASTLISDDTFQRFPRLINHPLQRECYSRNTKKQWKFNWEPHFLSQSNEINAHCESTLALLWQSLCTPNFSIEEIKLIVNSGLTPEDRNLIYEMVWDLGGKVKDGDLQWGEHHAFDKNKIFHFALAVGLVIWTKFYNLTQEQQNRVYGQLYELAGRPETTDSQWGKRHVLESMVRLADALARMEK